MTATALPANSSRGWFARLELEFASRDNAAILTANRHTGPLRLQRPFYPEEGVCHAYILHPPGGVAGGDRLELHAGIKRDAAVLITTPGATKFYRSGGNHAIQENSLQVEKIGRLEWLPQETIFFPGADARVVTKIDLEEGAGFMGWEILCLGLPGCGRPFDSGALDAALKITRAGRPLFWDRLIVKGADGMARPAGLRGHSVCGTFTAIGCAPEMVEPLRGIIAGHTGMLCGVTLMEDLLVARCLGDSSSKTKALFQELWQWLRPRLAGRIASAPRIWAT